MKKIFKLIALSAILLMLVGSFSACGDKEPSTTNGFPEPLPLGGTKWKLDYVNFQDSRDFVTFEPTDCDTCYTLVFDTDSTASGLSIINQLNVFRPYLNANRLANPSDATNLHGGNTIITMTELEEPFDGNLYCTLLKNVHSVDHEGPRLIMLVITDSGTRILIYKPY